MDFFNSIPFPYRFCPKIFATNCILSLFKKITAKILVIFLIFYFLCSINIHILSTDFGTLRNFVFGCLFVSPTFISLFLMAESVVMNNNLKHFVRQIKNIDVIMHQQLRINMRADIQRNHIRDQFWRWIRVTFYTACAQYFIAVLVQFETEVFKPPAQRQSVFFLGFIATIRMDIPLFIMQLYFFRIVTFVNMLKYRYRLINQSIRSFHTFTDLDCLTKYGEVRDFLNSDQSLQKLHDIRIVCRLLYTASDSINDLFKWSLLVCLFYEFMSFTVIGYLFFVTKAFYAFAVFALHFVIPSIIQIVSLTNACELTSQEVWSIYFIRIIFDFIKCD